MRVLLAKVGLDGHDRGVKVLALHLRDAGHEVIYTGLHERPSDVAAIALDEDVDVVGLSILSGAHVELATEVVDALRKVGAEDVDVVVGGTVWSDVDTLIDLGVRAVFPTGTPYEEIVMWFASDHG
jgi:methylmalonyl-CoA mutase C-terminal domain/subunit